MSSAIDPLQLMRSRCCYKYMTSLILSIMLIADAVALNIVCRRRAFARLAAAGGCTLVGMIVALEHASAACLPGDLSPDCIGVYKVPIDDAILPYVGTEAALKKFAPDTRYVPPIKSPATKKEAMKNLREQRLAADDIIEVVTAGRLEEAGIMVLKLLPQVTVAGRVLLTADSQVNISEASETIQSLRRQQLESVVEQVYVSWNSVDVTIGQGLRGEMGATVVAQLTILSEIKDAIRALDNLIIAMDKS
ncbi:hypothetical protein MPSEU_000194700 [Mayamaea pseudoterrestris]|nr:hypothetical protein MPSEU_000194700 [Mayamaea pseudoterrestris]